MKAFPPFAAVVVVIVVIVVNVVVVAAPAQSQDYAYRNTNNGTPVIHDHASTAAEGYFRGLADLWRGWGDYNYETSLASINNEEAERRELENSVARVNTRYERRELSRQYRFGSRRRSDSQNQNVASPVTLRAARARQPAKRLTSSHFDPVAKTLVWPPLLYDDHFAGERTTLERLISERTDVGPSKAARSRRHIRQCVARCRAKIKDNYRVITDDVIEAFNFLRRVENELRFPSMDDRLAAR